MDQYSRCTDYQKGDSMITVAPETAIIFGSLARGDYDAMSDKDILIIDSDRDNLRSAAVILEQRGWSVAQFTWTQMAVLKARQSLFLYHIVREGIILKDKEHRYDDLMSGFE